MTTPNSATDDFEARLRAVFDAAIDAIITIDHRGTMQSLNHTAERMFGYTAAELLGQNVSILMPAPFAVEHDGYLERYRRTGEKRIIGIGREAIAKRKDGTTFPIELAIGEGEPGSRHRFTGFIRDISKKEELEARFLRAQRLESVGTLVSGIAHDLNNILTPILMAVKLLKKDKPGLDRADLLDTAQTSAERGVELIRQLLTFAGGLNGERKRVSVQDVMREVVVLLDHSFPKSITIQHELTDRLLTVHGDPTQISQVLMNLCVNARDAMPEGGTLTLTLSQNRLLPHAVERYPGAKPGEYVVISVTDTGTGIPPDVQEKMFDPFFTTKPFGQGTGLGLSTVLGIVKSHGGFVNVYSELDRGTKMNIFLPAEPSLVAQDPAANTPNQEMGHGEWILVADDEKPILATVKAALESHGYRVLAANSGSEAIEHFRRHHETICLALIDMMMPGIDGPVVMATIHQESPNLPIVASSGLRPTGRFAAAIAAAKASFLLKPFSDDELLSTIATRMTRVVAIPSTA